jgi:hypothetical protein
MAEIIFNEITWHDSLHEVQQFIAKVETTICSEAQSAKY